MQLHGKRNAWVARPEMHHQHVFNAKRHPYADTMDHDNVGPNCTGVPADTTDMHIRIASIFIILAASLIGALFPILLRRFAKGRLAKTMLFASKFVGSGVIIGTAWMHLMPPAAAELGHDCVRPLLGDFDWAFFIALMTIMSMFLAEILATHFRRPSLEQQCVSRTQQDGISNGDNLLYRDRGGTSPAESDQTIVATEGHLGKKDVDDRRPNLAAQLTAVLILEFGVVFHSVFIGLVLATTSNLTVLLIAMVFHQLLEGLGLGARLAAAPWPGNRWWLPYMFACLFAVSTPLGTAVGLVAQPQSRAKQLLTTGIFDAISAGILTYTGLVELLAHEFLLSPDMRSSPLRTQLAAFACILAGAGGMAFLANWA
ncbi:hypothetical protein ACRALDRAFT_1045894 [Sodiomyces alcalophilus JCM 7366]|uniref:uncharacterized protein n=1 Tax=Sodiomyces alcalophilus JCM 7366 TaxID=591952 RepID=UPI0039B4E6EC